MRYHIHHITRFTYETTISESVMEVRMQPRSEGPQRCLNFALTTSPAARVMTYQDNDGNNVHHFDIPGSHALLTVTMDALVDCDPVRPLPYRLGPAGWAQLDALTAGGTYWEYLTASAFARPTPLLDHLKGELGLQRGNDPIVMLRRLMGEMYRRFEYAPQSTRVDSPIDDALKERRGVCQDFAHIFIALVRPLGVPARYVSGYLFRDLDSHDRSTDGATHAWVEALLPELGWVGFDPTNNLIAEDRHIRAAVGRDYHDVPPTRGIYKGLSTVRNELAVAVRVGSAPVIPAADDPIPFTPWKARQGGLTQEQAEASALQRQQQQQ
jgi:transglutaminase-like putative cysteine protease